ncbi:MBL fold metallo-hydrolase [Muricoccus radiodurans]|uniref:MBL fold metallo-hydrolase n=1 Tax=Muricoccus radiodurans TaxID=2231721 RepID=UPI003CF04AE9
MRVHVINCGAMRPYGGKLWDGVTSGLGAARLALRCLVAESEDGLILVDTGVGLQDVAHPNPRLSPIFRFADRVQLDPQDTAVARVRGLGLDPADVRHIVMTHLDFDHAGGISDFPGAAVHVHAVEAAAARERAGLKAAQRYRPAQIPAVMQEHDARDGTTPWMGLDAFGGRHGLPPGVLFVPLPGHTRGHCGVALDTGAGWVLHAGDAVFMHSELADEKDCPPLSSSYQGVMEVDRGARHASAGRLRALARERGAELAILCTHDPVTPRGDGRYHAGAEADPKP